MSNPTKSYTEMTTKELQEATKEFDAPFAALRQSKPLTAKDRETHRRAGKPGRPRIGQGATRVLVTIEGGLLSEADAYAKRHGLKRAELIARGLRLAMNENSGRSTRKKIANL